MSQNVALREIISMFRSAGSKENSVETRSSNGKGETRAVRVHKSRPSAPKARVPRENQPRHVRNAAGSAREFRPSENSLGLEFNAINLASRGNKPPAIRDSKSLDINFTLPSFIEIPLFSEIEFYLNVKSRNIRRKSRKRSRFVYPALFLRNLFPGLFVIDARNRWKDLRKCAFRELSS